MKMYTKKLANFIDFLAHESYNRSTRIVAKAMGKIKSYIDAHPDLFTYEQADHLHPHDEFLAHTILRLLPSRVTPNQLTFLRIVLTPIVFFFILVQSYQLGISLFILAALTDAMDGSLARTTQKITNFGKLFDPLADKLLIGSMVLLLMFQYFNLWLAVAVLGLEIIFIVSALVAKAKFKTVRAANVWGKVKMISQVIAVCLTLFALVLNQPQLIAVASGVFGVAIGFAVISLFSHGI